jgi:hypothetical protein
MAAVVVAPPLLAVGVVVAGLFQKPTADVLQATAQAIQADKKFQPPVREIVTTQYEKPVIFGNALVTANKPLSKDTGASEAAAGETAAGAAIGYLASMKQFVADIPKPERNKSYLGAAAAIGLAVASVVYLAVSISRLLCVPRNAE